MCGQVYALFNGLAGLGIKSLAFWAGICGDDVVAIGRHFFAERKLQIFVSDLQAGRICECVNVGIVVPTHVWEIYSEWNDTYHDHIQLVKVKSHMSLASVHDGSAGCSWADWTGNKAADLAARKCAAIHPMPPQLQKVIESSHLVIRYIARWLGTVGAHLVRLESPDVQPKPVAPAVTGYQGTVCAQSLLLIDIPTEEQMRASGQWRPRILHCEARRTARERRRQELAATGGG